jgi:predicted acyltransferase
LHFAGIISFLSIKKLWTGSFVFLTVGIDCVLLSALIYAIDFLANKDGSTIFFEVFGETRCSSI